jgi:hypothetical protein
MKKLTLAIAVIILALAAGAQPAITVLQALDTTYAYLTRSGSGNYLAGLSYNQTDYQLNLRTYNGTGFGTLVHTHTFGDANTGYYNTLIGEGNYIYAAGLDLQAIDITDVNAPVNGPEIHVGHYLRWMDADNGMLYLLCSETAGENVLRIYSLADPIEPQLVDSLSLPVNGIASIWNGRMYYMWNDAPLGNRIVAYGLSATAPYTTVGNIFTVNNDATPDLPITFISSGHFYARMTDSLFHLRIQSNGDLQWVSRTGDQQLYPFSIAAKDSTAVVQAGYQKIFVHYPGSNQVAYIDSTDIQTFDNFQNMLPIGDNFYYNSFGRMVMFKFDDGPAGIPGIATGSALKIYPNPATERWTVTTEEEGSYVVYDLHGKTLKQGKVSKGRTATIDGNGLASGIYYFMLTTADNRKMLSKLVKY